MTIPISCEPLKALVIGLQPVACAPNTRVLPSGEMMPVFLNSSMALWTLQTRLPPAMGTTT